MAMTANRPANGSIPKNGHKRLGTIQDSYAMPDLVEVQRKSFEWLLEDGLAALLEEISPIKDFTGERFEMSFTGHEILEPEYNEAECRERESTYSVPLHVTVELKVKQDGIDETKEQKIFFGDIPRMTRNGTFIINGAERVVISQLVRSPGAYYSVAPDNATGNLLASAKLIPYNGAWVELETNNRDGLFAKVDRKRKITVTSLLRAMSSVCDGTLADRYIGIDHSDRFANDLEREIYEALTEEGYRAAPQADLRTEGKDLPDPRLVADVAVMGHDGSELVVMLDQDPSENQDAEAEDKDRYKLLVNAGWKVHRICGADWYASEASRKKAYSQLKRACAKHGVKPWNTPWGVSAWDSLSVFKTLFPETATGDQPKRSFIEDTWLRDTDAKDEESALKELHKRLRPGELPTTKGAQDLIQMTFFEPKRYDMGDVGRHKLNRALGLNVNPRIRTLTKWDAIQLVSRLIDVNNGLTPPDDIDHLGNRRVRTVGELIKNQLHLGLVRMERVVKDRMTTHPPETTPAALINIRPIAAALKEFFGGSQLSQFMDQTNPLSELTHKRRLSALGPGGLTRDRAGFDVRDVHHSHYGRICPIETPEGPNIGLLGSLATYATVNDFGFIETPYRIVRKTISNKAGADELVGRTLNEDVKERSRNRIVAKAGTVITEQVHKNLRRLGRRQLQVQPYLTSDPEDVFYLSADQETDKLIGEAATPTDAIGQIIVDVDCRAGGEKYSKEPPHNVDYIDVSPAQTVSVSTGLIPFLEHDDATRALMGSNMQRQGVPLLLPQAPIVGTGMERQAAMDSGQVAVAEVDGIVTSATANSVVVTDEKGKEHRIPLTKFARSNQSTCLDQHPIVKKGQIVSAGQPLADSSSTDEGSLALGQNLLVGFMSWGGGNYEDAIILNEDLVKGDRFTSVHIEKREIEARETKLGPEEITRDIPNVGETNLANLDEDGIVVEGTWIAPGDILVGKITPKGETELTAEEKLLRAIFGEKARDVKDTSLRARHGEKGKVIKVTVIEKDDDRELPPGVTKMVRVWFAHSRKITQGDKMAGRHGNKGVVAMVLPREDMPHLEDGSPLDIVLNPIGVPSRMNLGQLLETHLGWAAHSLGFSAVTPVFDSATDTAIEDFLARAWFVASSKAIDHRDLTRTTVDVGKVSAWLEERGLNYDEMWSDKQADIGNASIACLALWLKDYETDHSPEDIDAMSRYELYEVARKIDREQGKAAPVLGKQQLVDGRTGEHFAQPVTVGSIYMMKLSHLAEDKIHARSTGPYSLITQQPLGGKAQFGGQRFGEMEVWALEAYSAPHTLQEMLTIKSDDVRGRVLAYEAIVKGQPVTSADVPESFNVLVKELQGLGLAIDLPEDVRVDDDDQDSIGIALGFGDSPPIDIPALEPVAGGGSPAVEGISELDTEDELPAPPMPDDLESLFGLTEEDEEPAAAEPAPVLEVAATDEASTNGEANWQPESPNGAAS